MSVSGRATSCEKARSGQQLEVTSPFVTLPLLEDLWHVTGCSPSAFVVSEVHMWGMRWLFSAIPGFNFSLPSRTGWLGPLWSFFSPQVSSESFHLD